MDLFTIGKQLYNNINILGGKNDDNNDNDQLFSIKLSSNNLVGWIFIIILFIVIISLYIFTAYLIIISKDLSKSMKWLFILLIIFIPPSVIFVLIGLLIINNSK